MTFCGVELMPGQKVRVPLPVSGAQPLDTVCLCGCPDADGTLSGCRSTLERICRPAARPTARCAPHLLRQSLVSAGLRPFAALLLLGTWLALEYAFPALISSALSGPAIVLHGILTGVGDTRNVLAANVLGNGVNVVCNALLIYGLGSFPRLGIFGAGLGTAIGAGVTLTYTLALFLRRCCFTCCFVFRCSGSVILMAAIWPWAARLCSLWLW